MAGSHIIWNLLLIAGVGVGIGSSFGEDQMDCDKITPSLCSLLTEAVSDTQKFAVVIGIKGIPYPAGDSACKGIDPKTDTTGKCGNDTAFYAALNDTLKENARKLFSSFELWDGKNPAQRLQAPSEPEWFFRNVLATKATLIGVRTESYTHIIDRYLPDGPARIHPAKLKNSLPVNTGAEAFLINGRKSVNVPARILRWNNPVNK